MVLLVPGVSGGTCVGISETKTSGKLKISKTIQFFNLVQKRTIRCKYFADSFYCRSVKIVVFLSVAPMFFTCRVFIGAFLARGDLIIY